MSKIEGDAGANAGKVGSDPDAAHHFAEGNDFGIPARDSVNRARDGEMEGRPAGDAPGYAGDDAGDVGVRTTGVGGRGGEPGHDSGGDLDPDVIGFGSGGAGGGGLAAKPTRGGELSDADATDGSSDAFAGGGHAEGRNSIARGSHGSAPLVHGDSTDHSGDDTSTNSPNSAGTVKSARGDDPGAEGEVSLDEATGDVDQGAET